MQHKKPVLHTPATQTTQASTTPKRSHKGNKAQQWPIYEAERREEMSEESAVNKKRVRRKREVRHVELTGEQLYELERLWFYYGNNRPKHTTGNHRFIQCLYERGEDKRLACNKSTMPTQECMAAVDAVLAGDFSTGHLTDKERVLRSNAIERILAVRAEYAKPTLTKKGYTQ